MAKEVNVQKEFAFDKYEEYKEKFLYLEQENQTKEKDMKHRIQT